MQGLQCWQQHIATLATRVRNLLVLQTRFVRQKPPSLTLLEIVWQNHIYKWCCLYSCWVKNQTESIFILVTMASSMYNYYDFVQERFCYLPFFCCTFHKNANSYSFSWISDTWSIFNLEPCARLASLREHFYANHETNPTFGNSQGSPWSHVFFQNRMISVV